MINRLIRISYYLLLIFTPLVMSSATSELFEFNKMMLIYAAASVIAFLWFIEMTRAKKIIIRRTPLDIPLLLFFISQVLSTVFSIDRQTSLFGYYDRFNGGLISIIAYLVLFYGFVTFMKRDEIKKLLLLIVVTSFIVILWGLPGKFGFDLSCWLFTGNLNNNCWTAQFRPAERMFSTLGQPNWLGAYLSVNFFIALYFFISYLKQRDRLKSVLFFLYLLVAMSFILFTRSRSALAAVLISLVFLASYLFVTGAVFRKDLKKILLCLLVIVVVPIVFFKTGIPKVDDILSLQISQKTSKIQNLKVSKPTPIADSGVTESFDIRKIVWYGAIDLGIKYPLLGTGVETFAYSYYFVRPAAHNLTSEWDYLYNKAHNEYLNYLATTGFLGLGTYLLIIIVFMIWSVRRLKDKKENILIVGLLASYITILITNFVGFSTSTINLFFFLIPALIFLDSFLSSDQAPKISKLTNSQIFVLLFTGLSWFAVMLFLVKYYVADTFYAKSDLYLQGGEYQQAAKILSSALDLHYEHVYEDKLSTTLADLALVAADSKQTDTATKLMSLSNYYNSQSLISSPKNVLYWKTTAKNEYLFYQIDLRNNHITQALNALSQATRLSPTDPKIPYSQALFYSLLYDAEKDTGKKTKDESLSLQSIAKSITLKSNYEDAYLLQAQLLKKYGQNDQAKKTYQYLLDHFDPGNQEAKQAIESL